MPSDSRPMTWYYCSRVTIYRAISHGNPVFRNIWHRSELSRSRKVKLTDNAIRIATHGLLLVFYGNYSAISHWNPVFQQMTLIWPFKVTKSQTDNVILFPTYDFLSVFYSRPNYSAISHGNPVFLQMTLIWLFKISKGQTDNAIRIATHDLLLVFHSNYSAISHRNPVFQEMTLIWSFKVTRG